MLHKEPEIISPKTFLLIQRLQAIPELKESYLVGGTALALQLGHRNSIDIDLFTQNDFDSKKTVTFLIERLFKVRIDHEFKNTLLTNINDVKVDFVKHPYQYLKDPITEDGISFLSKEDIAAMKLNAITGSGQRLKYFIDVYFLLEYFSVENMLVFYERKYTNSNPLIALKALSYFGDIDETLDSPRLIKPVSINNIKNALCRR